MRPASSSSFRSVLTILLMTAMAVGLAPTVATAQPAGEWLVPGPARSGLSAQVQLVPGSGALTMSVWRQGREVLRPAPVGITTENADLSRGLRFLGEHSRIVHERYRMTTGKQRDRSALMRETRLSFRGADDVRVDLLVRVADDGVAYRYVLPEAAGSTVTGEASAYSLPAGARAWLLPYNPQHERQRVETDATEAATGEYGNPALFQIGKDFALLTESDVDGSYSGARMYHEQGSDTYRVKLADERVSAPGPLETPWRTAIVGDLATVTESTLVDDLADSARFADTSWIRPGKVAWSWLSEHSSPRSFARQKEYVDFAARNGWPYVLVDEGWSEQWVPELTRYARARGVDILLWFHWNSLDTAEERESVLPQVRSWGVKGVKVDFMESDTQSRYRWYDTILQATARERLMINFHGSTIPHGLARTWPHVMTMEAVHGQEQLPQPDNNPVHPFTRNVVGSMDFTPVALEVGPRTSSVAHEAALAVAYESAWQHFADKPEAYERFPGVLRFLNQVPTVWDETRLIGGHPGDEAVLARRDDDRWFVGAIAAGPARTMTADLDFLRRGKWLLELVRDDQTDPRADVHRQTTVVRSGETISVDVPRDGGFAAVLCRALPNRTTCDEPRPAFPETTLTVSPGDAGDTSPGTSFEVSAEFTLDSADRAAHDVVLAPRPPEGWTVAGKAITTRKLDGGQSISGNWTVTVGEDAATGATEVPVAAEFRDLALPSGAPRVHVAKAVDAFVPPPAPGGEVWLSDLPFEHESNGYGPVERDASNGEAAGGDGNPITIGGASFDKGLGTHAPAEVTVYLGRACERFTALVGLDDETSVPGTASFQVVGDDGEIRHDSGVLHGGQQATPLSVDVSGVRLLTLRVADGGDGKNHDHADWANAKLSCT